VQSAGHHDSLIVGFVLDVRGGDFRLPSFTFNDPCQKDPNLKQEIERATHQSHIEKVRGRCEHRREDGDKQNSIPAFLSQEGDSDDSEVAQESEDEGKFKDEPESEDEPGTERDVLSHRDHRFEMGRLISEKETDAKGQRDEVAERGSEVEEKEGDQEDRHGGFQSLRMEQGGEGFPNLIEDDRNGKEKAAIEG